MTEVNQYIKDSLVVDINSENDWTMLTRKVDSSFRRQLTKLKGQLLSLAPKDDALFKVEMNSLKEQVTEELQRNYVKTNKSLRDSIQKLANALENFQFLNPATLTSIRDKLDAVYAHPRL